MNPKKVIERKSVTTLYTVTRVYEYIHLQNDSTCVRVSYLSFYLCDSLSLRMEVKKMNFYW